MTSSKDTVAISLRVPREWLARAEAIAKRIQPPGADFERSDGFRAAIEKGLEALEKKK